jgi:serine phosphatase RsbU (regulator of sigma subunit)
VQLKQGERIYFTTDGYADQFGGAKGKKLKYKELEKLLLETWHLPLQEQKVKLESFFESWKGVLEQVDDVTLIGIEV